MGSRASNQKITEIKKYWSIFKLSTYCIIMGIDWSSDGDCLASLKIGGIKKQGDKKRAKMQREKSTCIDY